MRNKVQRTLAAKLSQREKAKAKIVEAKEHLKRFPRHAWNRTSAQRWTDFQRHYEKSKPECIRRRIEQAKAQPHRDYHCEACGITDLRVLAVHHRLPLADGGTSDPSNLQTLCQNCHAIAHFELRAARMGVA